MFLGVLEDTLFLQGHEQYNLTVVPMKGEVMNHRGGGCVGFDGCVHWAPIVLVQLSTTIVVAATRLFQAVFSMLSLF